MRTSGTVVRRTRIEGQRMLDRVGGFMREVGTIVRSHHERWDGGGYPDGLAGEAIPLEARIIAGCDAWNAMTTDRSYRAALSDDVAADELRVNAGSQFDPEVVTATVAVLARPGRPAPKVRPHSRLAQRGAFGHACTAVERALDLVRYRSTS